MRVSEDKVSRAHTLAAARTGGRQISIRPRPFTTPGEPAPSPTVQGEALGRAVGGSSRGVVQLYPVHRRHEGRHFHVRDGRGRRQRARLVRVAGGGWYHFEGPSGRSFTVRGHRNILGPDHEMDWRSRLRRAHRRARFRRRNQPPLGRRVDAPTPFGLTGLSRQRFSPSEPQTTTRLSDFPGTQHRTGDAYAPWLADLSSPSAWSTMSQTIDAGSSAPPPSFTPQQNRAAATVYGITHYSEPRRFPGSAKVARSAIRMIGQGTHPPSEFPHLFPMAQPGGSGTYRTAMDTSDDELDDDQQQVIEHMSDSSDDEEESDTDSD